MRRAVAGRWVEDEGEGIDLLLPARAPNGVMNASSTGSTATSSSATSGRTGCGGLQQEGAIVLVFLVVRMVRAGSPCRRKEGIGMEAE